MFTGLCQGRGPFSNYRLGPLLPALGSLLGFASLALFLMPRLPLTFCFISDSGGQDYVETVIPRKQLPSAAFFSETQRQFSRYFIEFEELQLLGKGAFGAVIKVWYSIVPSALRAPPLFISAHREFFFYSYFLKGVLF